jgi:hypothetical protein
VGALDCRGRGDRTLVWNDTVMAEKFLEDFEAVSVAVKLAQRLLVPSGSTGVCAYVLASGLTSGPSTAATLLGSGRRQIGAELEDETLLCVRSQHRRAIGHDRLQDAMTLGVIHRVAGGAHPDECH